MKTQALKIENGGQRTRNQLARARMPLYFRALPSLALLCFCLRASAQGTAFTYQGQLNLNSAPANGNYDFQFVLFNTNQFGFPATPILTNANVSVNNGLFTTTLDFGGGIFTGSNFWLDVSVRTNGTGAFTDLSPRQPIAPAPYAIAAANLTGVLENNTIQTGVSLGTIGGGAGNAIQSGASFATVGGGGNNVIQIGADHSTIGGGSGNNIVTGAFESFVGGGQNNYIYSHWSAIAGGLFNSIFTNADYSFVGGGYVNQIQSNASYSMIGGGQFNSIGDADSVIAGGLQNLIQTNDSAAAIGGGQNNKIQTGAPWATIGGGLRNTIETNAFASAISGGEFNDIQNHAVGASVGGGNENVIQNEAFYSTISGGSQNSIQSNAVFSIISGGNGNVIQPSDSTVIAGGQNNVIQTTASGAVIGGGLANTNGGLWSTIGGGIQNIASGICSTVPGGSTNLAIGNFSFAAGQQAQALHQGAFVWADSQSPAFSSTANDQFLIRANGGVGINNNNPGGASLRVVGNRTGGWGSSVSVFENTSTAAGSSPALRVLVDGGNAPDGALSVSDNGTGPIAEFGNGLKFVANIANDGTITCTSLVQTSDRNAKENFASLSAKTVLAKVAAMPVTEWNYKDDGADKKHIGPMAQDFYAAFGLNGTDDKHISVVDEGGVALAAIQGLNQKVEEQQSELKQKQTEIADLKMRLEKLEHILGQRNGNAK